MRRALFVASACMGAAACGGPKLGEPQAPSASQMAANTQVTNSVSQIAQLGENAEGVFSLYSAISTVGQGAAGPGARGSALSTMDLSTSGLSPAGCATGSAATGWTYNNCQNGSGTTINGSVKIATGKTDIDLTIQTQAAVAGAKITIAGSVENDGSRMKGNLTYELKVDLGLGGLGGIGNLANQKTTLQYDLTYTKGPSACITMGTVRIDYEAAGQTGAAQFEYTGCGMFKVRNST